WATGAPTVRFRIAPGATGQLSVGSSLPATEVEGELLDGVYQCTWILGNAAGPHEVEAVVFFGSNPVPATAPLRFTASARAASEISYADPCDSGVTNVEQALRTLYANQRVLETESGDAQMGRPQQSLARPLRVRVARGQWSSTAGIPQVRFTATAGGGRLASTTSGPFNATSVTVNQVPGQDGLYECWWELGANGAQAVQAEVVLTGIPNQTIAPVMFQAHLHEAAELQYTKQGATTATTVKAALDELFSMPLPVGAIVDYASQSAPSGQSLPRGFLPCDGRRVPRADYAALYALIGDSFRDGEGDEQTFALPSFANQPSNLYKLIKY
ncbi:MAG TPA: phage tail protein, partial [Haliangium sp.]|nr:phage tail protein [Haliangium sp.]